MNTHSCPQCSISLRTVKVETHYGRPFYVEQCGRCGGLWFDKYEQNRISNEDVEELENVDEKALSKNARISKSLHCPKDSSALTLFKDINFPKDITIESCGKCGGLWFNKGELRRFKFHFRKIGPEKKKRRSSSSALTHAFMMINDDQAIREKKKRLKKG